MTKKSSTKKIKPKYKKFRARDENTHFYHPSTSLTMEMVEELCRIVSEGNFRYVARNALGIPGPTMAHWITKGNKLRKDFSDGVITEDELDPTYHLVVGLDQAESVAHQDLIHDVVNCNDPRVKLEFLKRRYNKLYSNNPNAVVDDETQEEIKLDAMAILREKLGRFVPQDDNEED